eukprot:TRINITY_DN9391_c0_g1_i1.p1 TRINITY_DN9391_c0_g1~~TRINITY_DN9391_c0_g1_i1.p1  ORF type:complete len:1293 (-),score=185.35 TRINITY_DN9391_c0_g1_i1:106-3984(-)
MALIPSHVLLFFFVGVVSGAVFVSPAGTGSGTTSDDPGNLSMLKETTSGEVRMLPGTYTVSGSALLGGTLSYVADTEGVFWQVGKACNLGDDVTIDNISIEIQEPWDLGRTDVTLNNVTFKLAPSFSLVGCMMNANSLKLNTVSMVGVESTVITTWFNSTTTINVTGSTFSGSLPKTAGALFGAVGVVDVQLSTITNMILNGSGVYILDSTTISQSKIDLQATRITNISVTNSDMSINGTGDLTASDIYLFQVASVPKRLFSTIGSLVIDNAHFLDCALGGLKAAHIVTNDFSLEESGFGNIEATSWTGSNIAFFSTNMPQTNFVDCNLTGLVVQDSQVWRLTTTGTISLTDSTLTRSYGISNTFIQNMFSSPKITVVNMTAIQCTQLFSGKTIIIRNSNFIENEGITGGVMEVGDNGTVTIENSTFTNNKATLGSVLWSSKEPTLSETNVEYINNTDSCGSPLPYASDPTHFEVVYAPTVLPLIESLVVVIRMRDSWENPLCFLDFPDIEFQVDTKKMKQSYSDGSVSFAGISMAPLRPGKEFTGVVTYLKNASIKIDVNFSMGDTCGLGYIESDVEGGIECIPVSPCEMDPCEGSCNPVGTKAYFCTCPLPAFLNETDLVSCICPDGYFKDSVSGGCTSCDTIQNCLSTPTCIDQGTSRCESCGFGYYLATGLDKDECLICPDIDACGVSTTCTDDTDSTCTDCIDGYYEETTEQGTVVCSQCPGVVGCTSTVLCTSNSTSTCSLCSVGFYLDKSLTMDRCLPCNPIDNCNAPLLCDSPSTSTCGDCYKGYLKKSIGGSMICEENRNCKFQEWGSWGECSKCLSGTRERYREIAENNEGLHTYCLNLRLETGSCGFPCVENMITSPSAGLVHLYESFSQWSWLEEEISIPINLTSDEYTISILIRDSNKRDSKCSNSDIVTDTLLETATFVLPGISNDTWIIEVTNQDEGCLVTFGIPPSNVATNIGIILGTTLGFCLVLLVIVLLFLGTRKQRLNMKILPKDVRYFYDDFYSSKNSWTEAGSGGVKFYSKKLTKGSEDWARMNFLLKTFCCGQGIKVDEAYAVFNPTLVGAFISQVSITQQRMIANPEIFNTKTFLMAKDADFKTWVLSKFQERVEEGPWNYKPGAPIILPGIHGTDIKLAWKICETGFANLSSLDDGFFGKGIYFTTYALYALTYLEKKNQPAMMVSWVLPGNTYPVTENSQDPAGFSGQPLKSGYNSHYVVTTSKGQPPKGPKDGVVFDEIVIPQEAQVAPALILQLRQEDFQGFRGTIDRFERGQSLQESTSASTS